MPDSPFMGFSGPLYDQVHKHLRARILAGEWEHWQPLPPEVLLSQELGVSVGTVRKAMEKLMQERIVVRERGRGTFVRRDASQKPPSALLLRDRDGNPVEIQKALTGYSVARISGRAGRLLAPKLGPTNALSAIRFERTWQLAKLPVCCEVILINQQTFQQNNNSSEISNLSGEELLGRYAERYRLQLQSSRWEISSQFLLASEEAVKGLPGPIAVITRISFDASDEPFEVRELIVSLATHTFEIAK